MEFFKKRTVDLIAKSRATTTYEASVITSLKEEMIKQGCHVRVIYLDDGGLGSYLHHAKQKPPSCILYFDPFFATIPPIFDLIGVPHIYWPESKLFEMIHLLESQYGVLATIDRSIAHWEKTLFLPRPSHEIQGSLDSERQLDLILFADLVDPEDLFKRFEKTFSSSALLLMQQCLQKDRLLHPAEALFKQEEDATLRKISRRDRLFFTEVIGRATHTRELIESFGDQTIHVYGNYVGNNWLLRLKNANSVHLHAPLAYSQNAALFTETKIIVMDHPTYFDGNHPLLLSALQQGALVLTNSTSYLAERYLQDEVARKKAIQTMKNQNFYSWEKAAQTILRFVCEN